MSRGRKEGEGGGGNGDEMKNSLLLSVRGENSPHGGSSLQGMDSWKGDGIRVEPGDCLHIK